MTNQLPPEIYRRRRIAAVVILIVLLLLIVWVVKAIAGDDTPAQQTTVSRTDGKAEKPSADPKAPYEASASASEAATKSAGEKSSEEPSPLANKKDCTLQDLELIASTDRPNYGSEQPELALTLKNPTGGTCNINLDQNTLRFEIYELASYKRIWSDLDCHASEGKGSIAIEPGKEVVYSVKWSRLSSAPGKCTEADRQTVGEGAYMLYGLVGYKHSDVHTFNLG